MKVKVEVRKSTIPNAGNGVFATEDIKKGEYVCHYDGEDIEMEKSNEITDITYLIHNPLSTTTFRIGYNEPKTKEGVGQIVNDGECPKIDNLQKEHEINRVLDEYEMKSKEKANIGIDTNFKMIAGKDIKKKQELFYHYGRKYWIFKQLELSNNSMTKLILYNLLFPINLKTLTNETAKDLMTLVMMQNLESELWKTQLSKIEPRNLIIGLINQK